jgi:long-chain acyl-CoA synthetase
MQKTPPALLLTGATGFVGSELLGLWLAANRGCRIAVLSRQPHRISELNSLDGVIALQGDIGHPSLGLGNQTYDELAESITGIMHCAANTRFTLSLDEARAANTEGTQNLLRFARKCRELEKFAFVSTAYVVGKASGHFLEGPIHHQSGYHNAYQQSKHDAEDLVTKAMDQLPACIFRLSSIVGDSRTGAVRQFNYVHQLIKLFPRNALPMIPGIPDATLDLIANDWALPALRFLFDHGFVAGSFYHICAGPDHSLTLSEMLEIMLRLFESHEEARKWLPIRVPALVSLSQYDEFVEQSRGGGDKLLNELLRVLGYFLPHFGILQTFDNQKTLNMLAKSGLRLPPARSYFEKVVRYCLETNSGANAPGVARPVITIQS